MDDLRNSETVMSETTNGVFFGANTMNEPGPHAFSRGVARGATAVLKLFRAIVNAGQYPPVNTKKPVRSYEPMRRFVVILLTVASQAQASGFLSDNLRISSEVLGYDLQYRVYLPEAYDALNTLPVIYVTDGPSYISEGRMPRVLDREIGSGRITPVIAVFVDATDPDDPDVNRRNQQFVCNKDYLRFFSEELVPTIDGRYRSAGDRESRVILGVSFGGLNAACFGIMGSETFGGIGMHSPAVHPVPGLLSAYEQVDRLPIRVFLTTGDTYDNAATNRQFRRILDDKGYDIEFREVAGRHNWDNWRPLIDDALRFFFGPAGR